MEIDKNWQVYENSNSLLNLYIIYFIYYVFNFQKIRLKSIYNSKKNVK